MGLLTNDVAESTSGQSLNSGPKLQFERFSALVKDAVRLVMTKLK